MLCYHNRDMLSASIICAGWDKNKGGQVYCLPLGGMIIQGGPKVMCQRFELIARPLIT